MIRHMLELLDEENEASITASSIFGDGRLPALDISAEGAVMSAEKAAQGFFQACRDFLAPQLTLAIDHEL